MEILSKRKIGLAADVLKTANPSSDEYKHAEKLVNEWREVHLFALVRLLDEISFILGPNNDYLVAGRLKKLNTIKDKLTRPGGIRHLTTMYDIVGCRIVVDNLQQQEEVCNKLAMQPSCDFKHTDRHNYISSPKEDGYRGRHLIFRYKHPEYGFELKTELQVRTKLQHSWATAVELHDAATGSRIKFEEKNSPESLFFRHMSNVIRAEEEGLEYSDLPNLKIGEKVFSTLRAATESIILLGYYNAIDSCDYILIDFDPTVQTIEVIELNKEIALLYYFSKELDPDLPDHNFLLVKGNSIEQLRELYPNYFGDISTFVGSLKKLIER